MALSAGPGFRPVSETKKKRGGEGEREKGGDHRKGGLGVFFRSLLAARVVGRTP